MAVAWGTASVLRLQSPNLLANLGTACAGSTKREPTVVGKPEEFMLANIADSCGLKRDQICMVGDRLDTDIQFGRDGGLTTLLVLSGAEQSPNMQAMVGKSLKTQGKRRFA